MGHLDNVRPIGELGHSNLWVLFGKSNSGKTEILSTFPKKMLYLRVGDDGSNTIAHKKGIDALEPENPAELRDIVHELLKDKKYETVACDTFSFVVNEWIDKNAVQKKKRMTQQAWGDLGTDTQELIKLFNKLAQKKIVVLTCHQITDSVEGMEEELTPDVRPNVSKGARTYLEGMANYGIHTTVLKREKVKEDGSTIEVVKYGAHLGAHPYYWTKFQVPKGTKIPGVMLNPSYDKIMALVKGEDKNE